MRGTSQNHCQIVHTNNFTMRSYVTDTPTAAKGPPNAPKGPHKLRQLKHWRYQIKKTEMTECIPLNVKWPMTDKLSAALTLTDTLNIHPWTRSENWSSSNVWGTSQHHFQTMHTTNLIMRSYVTDTPTAAKGPPDAHKGPPKLRCSNTGGTRLKKG